MILSELFNKYDTDKGNLRETYHNYGLLYEEIFSHISVENLLEIGVDEGNSLRAWAEYFPNAMIYGADKNFRGISNPRIKQIKCDQNNIQSFFTPCFEVLPLLDIIIDDGGHCMNHHAITLAGLWRKLKSGGFYIIEDVHTCNFPHIAKMYSQPILNDTANTLKMFKGYLMDNNKINHVFETPFAELQDFKVSEIDYVRIIGDDNMDTLDIERIKNHGLIIIKKI